MEILKVNGWFDVRVKVKLILSKKYLTFKNQRTQGSHIVVSYFERKFMMFMSNIAYVNVLQNVLGVFKF